MVKLLFFLLTSWRVYCWVGQVSVKEYKKRGKKFISTVMTQIYAIEFSFHCHLAEFSWSIDFYVIRCKIRANLYYYYFLCQMWDVLLFWIMLAGFTWVHYELNPGLAVPFSRQLWCLWHSGPRLLTYLYVVSTLNVASHFVLPITLAYYICFPSPLLVTVFPTYHFSKFWGIVLKDQRSQSWGSGAGNPLTNMTATKFLLGCMDTTEMDLFHFYWPLSDGHAS